MPPKSDGIRAFLALELPEEVRHQLHRFQQSLSRQIEDRAVRWVKPHAFHLTLFFLGEGVTSAKIDLLRDHLLPVGQRTEPIALSMDRLGCFPRPARPQVIWAGVEGDLKPLQTLKKRVDQVVSALGWSPERPRFHPHITLGRVKNSRAAAQADLAWGQPAGPAAWTATTLTLMQSDLDPQRGATYTPVFEIPFIIRDSSTPLTKPTGR